MVESLAIGIDIGGTFTDIAMVSTAGEVHASKAPTTPADPSRGAFDALERASAQLGEGYVLAWPSALGPRPYQSGHGDQVYKVRWGRNSIYSPPNAYFHQHFNTGPDSAKHVAVYGPRLPLGVHNLEGEEGWRGYLSYREGGTLIEYEDEDPRVRRDFEAELVQRGISCQMPAVNYR